MNNLRSCYLYLWEGGSRAWYGMKRNGTEISVRNIEDARMEWNGRFQEWNGKQSSILPYQFRTKFCALYLQKNTYGCRVVTNNWSQRHYNSYKFTAYCYILWAICYTFQPLAFFIAIFPVQPRTYLKQTIFLWSVKTCLMCRKFS